MKPRPAISRRAAALARLLLPAVLLLASGTSALRLFRMRGDLRLTQAPPARNMPPALAFGTIAFGGFRGILADFLWMRATDLQDRGRYFELNQLAEWITRLQPRSPVVWSFQSWNLAYNIPALLRDDAEKWRWVRHGILLLLDDGLRLNPASAPLHADLAWLFLHKIGLDLDESAPYYRARLAESPPDALDPAACRAVETALGVPLDWSTPQAHAIYWATAGLPFARTPAEDLSLRRIRYQALLQLVAAGDALYRAPAIDAARETLARHPGNPALRRLLPTLEAAPAP